MVGWHNAVTGTAVANWWTDGSNAISFSRGSAGFVAINNGSAPITRAFQTGLAVGTYCDVIHATFSAGSCTGAAVVVDAAGNANVTVAAKDSVALHINARVSAGGPATLSPSPSSLSFAATTVGGASATQGVTVSNTGGTSATVSSVAVNGDFTQMNSCATVAAGASCTVSVTFRPTAAGTRTGTLTVTSNAGNNPTAVSLTGAGADSTSNIAVGKSATANSVQQTFAATNSNDGNTSTYWEGAGAYPQWLQIDLGSATSVGRVAVKLPPTWGSRTQTFSVLGSTDGTNFTTLSASASRVFDPSTVNTVTITFSAATVRFVRLNVTANTGAGGGQVAEFQIYPASAGGTSATLAANPASLAFSSTVVNTSSAAQNVTVSNSGSAAGAVSSVTASGDFSQTNTCGTSIPAGGSCTVSVTFRPTTSGSRTGTLTVSSNASNPTLSVALTGTSAPAGNSNLAAGRATSESGHQQTYVAGNAVDGNQATYWEGQANAYPNWLQVDLGSAQTVGRVVLKLPAAWGARTQTLSILGSADGTTWTTLKASAAYTYPAGNVVSIALTGSSQRYVRINITANTGAAGGQVSELEVYSS
jgi:hypothetical protein